MRKREFQLEEELIKISTAAKLRGVSRQAMYYRVLTGELKVALRDDVEFVKRSDALELKFRQSNKKKAVSEKAKLPKSQVKAKRKKHPPNNGAPFETELLQEQIMSDPHLSSDTKVVGWLMASHAKSELPAQNFIETATLNWTVDEKIGTEKLAKILSELERSGYSLKITVESISAIKGSF